MLAQALPATGVAPKSNLAGSCPSVLARYWTSVPCQHWYLYWFTTGITPKSVVSRHLVSGLGLYYASTAPTLGPIPTVQYIHVYNWRGTAPFLNTGMNPTFPSATLDTAQHWPSIAKNLPKIGCQYRTAAGMITPVCTWWPILAQTIIANNCFWHSNGPVLCRTLVFSLPEWCAAVKVTHGPVMCRPWAELWLLYSRNWML